MTPFHDIAGQRFSRLVAIRVVGAAPNRGSLWECRCDCGNLRVSSTSNLRRGLNKSCGCLHRDLSIERLKSWVATNGNGRKTHGLVSRGRRPQLYTTWVNMRARCSRKNHPSYHLYGARGIKVCKRWDDFTLFVKDMGARPDGLTLERINNNGNYEPGNCRWASSMEQAQNMRTVKLVRYKGEALSINAWARKLGIPGATLNSRLAANWPLSKALTTRKSSK